MDLLIINIYLIINNVKLAKVKSLFFKEFVYKNLLGKF